MGPVASSAPSKRISMTRILSVAAAVCAVALLSAFTLGVQTVKIQTTAVCGMCKDRIEGVLGQTDGIESARLDLTTKKVKIKYDDTKHSEASLRALISKIGYGADGVDADAEAFEALPGCCKSAKACKDAKGATGAVDGVQSAGGVANAANAPDAKPARACCAGKKAAACKDKPGS